MFIIVVHTVNGPGNSRAFGPFEDEATAVASASRAVTRMRDDWEVIEVVRVEPLTEIPEVFLN